MAILTSGAITEMLNKRKIPRPILKVIRMTMVNQFRQYRIVLSDGHNRTSNAFLSPRLNKMVAEECLVPNDIVVLNKYSCRSTPFIVVHDLCVVVYGGPKKLESESPTKMKDQRTGSAHIAVGHEGIEIETHSSQGNMKSSDDLLNTSSHRQSEEQFSDTSRVGTSSIASSLSDITDVYTSNAKCNETNIQENNGTIHSNKGLRLINQLNPHSSRHWTILARVTRKTDIRHWKYRANGEPGYSFSVLLQDSSGEIRATAFCKQVDDFDELVIENGVYHISNGQVKQANQQYNNADNEYEILFNYKTVINLYDGIDEFVVPKQEFDPVLESLTDLFKCRTGDAVHVVGIVKSVTDYITGSTKDGRDFVKRDVVLVDDSGTQCTLTIWGDNDSLCFDAFYPSIVAAMNCTISNWYGGSLSTNDDMVVINPEFPATERLEEWFHSSGYPMEFKAFTLPAAKQWFSGLASDSE